MTRKEAIKNDLGADCISRKRAIERLELNFPISHGADNSRDRHRYMQALADLQVIKELPSVTPQEPRWILVNEGMPKHTGFYLIQYSREICHDELAVAYYSVEEKESDPDYEWEFKPICGEYKEVIAWMPLPKPYEPQESEGKE